MNRRFVKYTFAVAILAMTMACKKAPPAPPPPPPPPPAKVEAPPPKPNAPVVTNFSVEPTTIQRGQSATLRWAVAGADAVTIDQGIGNVPTNGTRSVSPAARTTYRLTARNAGGETSSQVIVNVVDPPKPPPPPPPPPPGAPKKTLQERLSTEVQDVFDYDRYDVRSDASATLQANAAALKAIIADFPSAVITLEGHCDERGSAEYNLGLGDRRASSVKEFLATAGVTDSKLQPVSYGKERPQCSDDNEACYQKNRRVHFVAQ